MGVTVLRYLSTCTSKHEALVELRVRAGLSLVNAFT